VSKYPAKTFNGDAAEAVLVSTGMSEANDSPRVIARIVRMRHRT
jgi:hypothetical protein